MIAAWISAKFAAVWARAALVGGIVLAVLAAALRLMSIGAARERAKQAERNAAAEASRNEVDHEIADADPGDVRRRLDGWMRNE